MKDYIKNVFWIGMLVGLGILTSCQDDMLTDRQPSGDAIVFTTLTDSLVESRGASSVSERHFLGLIGKDSLYITLTEEENTAPVFPESNADTPSRAMYGDGFSKFYLNAYLEDGAEFMKKQEVTKSGNAWSYSPIKYWPQTGMVDFFGYASNLESKLVTPNINKDTYTGKFSYTLPLADADRKDAEKQPDLVFSIVTDQSKQTVNGQVHLPFYHALSAIHFKVETLPEDVKLEEKATWDISLANVSTSGECTYTKGSPLNFQWMDTDAKGSYTQQYLFSALKNGVSNEQTFMMIPQSLEKAALRIAFTYAGLDYTFEKDLKAFSSQWDANKKYTYVISISEAVEVEITDKVSGAVKSDVVIRNIGLSDAYIRAAIVGYWENDGNVVAWWDLDNTEDGTLTKADDWADYWATGTDGYFYYKYPIKVGATPTVSLFEQYELKKKAPYEGATLKLNIVVQAVKHEGDQRSLKAAWTSGMPSDFISATFEETNQGE